MSEVIFFLPDERGASPPSMWAPVHSWSCCQRSPRAGRGKLTTFGRQTAKEEKKQNRTKHKGHLESFTSDSETHSIEKHFWNYTGYQRLTEVFSSVKAIQRHSRLRQHDSATDIQLKQLWNTDIYAGWRVSMSEYESGIAVMADKMIWGENNVIYRSPTAHLTE